MKATTLKNDLLSTLYTNYKLDQSGVFDIQQVLNDHGVGATTSMLEYGKALKSAGLLKDYRGNEDSFMASISIAGINCITNDVKNEIRQLLIGVKDDPAHFYPVMNHLEFLPKTYQATLDLCHFMHENDYADIKITDDDVFIRITDRGLAYIGDSADPSDENIRLIA